MGSRQTSGMERGCFFCRFAMFDSVAKCRHAEIRRYIVNSLQRFLHLTRHFAARCMDLSMHACRRACVAGMTKTSPCVPTQRFHVVLHRRGDIINERQGAQTFCQTNDFGPPLALRALPTAWPLESEENSAAKVALSAFV